MVNIYMLYKLVERKIIEFSMVQTVLLLLYALDEKRDAMNRLNPVCGDTTTLESVEI